MRISSVVLLVGILASHALPPPLRREAGLAVDVRPTVTSRRGDTVTVGYTVSVSTSSTDSLASFAVDAPGITAIATPTPASSWLTITRMRARHIGKWVHLGQLTGPGQSTPRLELTGIGLLDVVPFWAARPGFRDSVITESPVENEAVTDTLVVVNGVQGSTVGVVAIPAGASTAGLADRLGGLIEQACALGWIDNRGVCNSLHAKAKPQAGPLGAMLNELRAQRGKHVNEAAFSLLSDNAAFLTARL